MNNRYEPRRFDDIAPTTEHKMATELRDQLARLEFPSTIEDMDFKKIHDIWRNNNNILLEVLNAIDLNSFPLLAVHGADKFGLEYLKGHSIPISVWINDRQPVDKQEALTMLYGLTECGLNHSNPISKSGDKGGFIVIRFKTTEKKQADFLSKKTKLRMTKLHSIEQYPIPRDETQELSPTNYQWCANADSSTEADIFNNLRQFEDERILVAAEFYTPDLHDKNSLTHFTVLTTDIPNYDNVASRTIMGGYVEQIGNRLRCQAAICKILEKIAA